MIRYHRRRLEESVTYRSCQAVNEIKQKLCSGGRYEDLRLVHMPEISAVGPAGATQSGFR